MQKKPVRFVITCPARTGSSMLRIMLNKHPDIICHGESITRKTSPGLGKAYQNQIGKTEEELKEIRDKNPVHFLYQYVWGRTDCRAIGVKIKYEQLEEFPEVMQAILADPEILIVHITRDNLLKRYISHRLARTRKTPMIILKRDAKTAEQSSTSEKIVVDPQECIEDMKKTQAEEERFNVHFQSHRIFDAVYEKLVAPGDKSIIQMQSFLGVDPLPLEPETVKINSDRLEDLIANYTELSNALQNTPFSRYLT